jgi:hypothetical protein
VLPVLFIVLPDSLGEFSITLTTFVVFTIVKLEDVLEEIIFFVIQLGEFAYFDGYVLSQDEKKLVTRLEKNLVSIFSSYHELLGELVEEAAEVNLAEQNIVISLESMH